MCVCVCVILTKNYWQLQGKGVETSTEQTDNIVQKVEEVPQAVSLMFVINIDIL